MWTSSNFSNLSNLLSYHTILIPHTSACEGFNLSIFLNFSTNVIGYAKWDFGLSTLRTNASLSELLEIGTEPPPLSESPG